MRKRTATRAGVMLAGATAVAVITAFAVPGPAGASPTKGSRPHKTPSPTPSPTATPSPTVSPTPSPTSTSTGGTGSATFSVGELQDSQVGATGCGTNIAGEPAIHVSRAGLVALGSEDGLGGGSELWRGAATTGACGLTYAGQPNAAGGVGASGGDIDLTWAPALSSAGTYRLYVASLNLGSVNVAVSNDNGQTFSQTPVQAGLPVDDREWIAAAGPDTSLLTFHDITTNDIDVLRSTNGGSSYTQVSQAIPLTDYKSGANELGNLVIDHDNASPVPGGFWAYQSFVAPSTSSGSDYNEAFVAVSQDGGTTWTDKAIPCSTQWGGSLDHNFPNISVAPNGTLWYAVSNDTSVFTATSADHGASWTCSSAVSQVRQAIFPWLVATSAGVDLVYYGAPTAPGPGQTFSVYFAQNPTSTATGWGASQQVVTVHSGGVCEGGVSCTGGRQLFDDFGVDTDAAGFAHIAYSHDAPNLGGGGTYTGYAVQTGGSTVGAPN